MKNIVFCCDGTWDTPANATNVFKISRALPNTANQAVFYDKGVGAGGIDILNLLGGAFGTGLWEKIKNGYRTIAPIYEPGDAIFIFGFSRGAFTARALAGMIAVCGLPTKNYTDDVTDTAFDAYHHPLTRQALLDTLKDRALFDAKITMVGVWDTVGALGIPAAIGAIDPLLYGFLDTSLHPDVLNAYQALAIDEHRLSFRPTLWTSKPRPGQTLEQVWFSGAHSDVGGGAASEVEGKPALSNITLAWMLSKAAPLGLQIDPAAAARYPLPIDPDHAGAPIDKSWNIGWGVQVDRAISDDAVLADSVAARIQSNAKYRPANLTFHADALAATYGSAAVVSAPGAAGANG